MSWPHIAGCGTVIDEELWNTMVDRKIGEMLDMVVEQRLCPCGCGSHLMIETESSGVHPDRLEGLRG